MTNYNMILISIRHVPNEASEAVRLLLQHCVDASKLLTRCTKNYYTNCHSDDLFVGMSL